MVQLLVSLFADDNGVSLAQYQALYRYCETLPDWERLRVQVFKWVDATDDRFYLNEQVAKLILEKNKS